MRYDLNCVESAVKHKPTKVFLCCFSFEALWNIKSLTIGLLPPNSVGLGMGNCLPNDDFWLLSILQLQVRMH